MSTLHPWTVAWSSYTESVRVVLDHGTVEDGDVLDHYTDGDTCAMQIALDSGRIVWSHPRYVTPLPHPRDVAYFDYIEDR